MERHSTRVCAARLGGGKKYGRVNQGINQSFLLTCPKWQTLQLFVKPPPPDLFLYRCLATRRPESPLTGVTHAPAAHMNMGGISL